MALRADSDIPAVAAMLGIGEAQLRSALGRPAEGSEDEAAMGEATLEPAQLRALANKRRNGEALSPEEEAQLRAAMQTMQRPGGGFGGGGARNGAAPASRDDAGTDYQFGGEYWAIALRNGEPVPVPVRTGVTDLEYSEVIAGLGPDDQVLLLPSTSLFEQQEALQRFIADRFSSSPFQQGSGRGR